MITIKNTDINASWQEPVPYGSMLHISPTNLHLQTAKRISTPQQNKSAIQNSASFEKHWKNSQEKVRKMGH